MIGRGLRAWVDLLSVRESATSLALFRIGMGLGVWLTVGGVVTRGLVPVLWYPVADGGMRRLGAGPWLVELLGGPTPVVVQALVATALLGATLLVLGIGGRAASILTLVSTINVVNLNGHAGGSYDELLTNGLWLTVLGPGHQTLSLTAYARTGRFWPAVEVLAFPRWLVAWQLVLMYCATGLQKVSFYWVPGGDASALYYILQQPTWHRIDMRWLAWVYPLTQLGSTVTWFWEVFSPLWFVALVASVRQERAGGLGRLLLRVRLRSWYAAVGVLLHLLIWLTMEVGPFTFLSLAFYAAMIHPWEWERLRRR